MPHFTSSGITWHFTFLAISLKLGLWSCRLWYQHPSRVLTLLTKQDSGLLPGIFQYCFLTENQGKRGDVLPFHLIPQRLTGIMVFSTVVPTYFTAVHSLDKTRFRFIAGHLPILFLDSYQGERGDVWPFHLIAQR